METNKGTWADPQLDFTPSSVVDREANRAFRSLCGDTRQGVDAVANDIHRALLREAIARMRRRRGL